MVLHATTIMLMMSNSPNRMPGNIARKWMWVSLTKFTGHIRFLGLATLLISTKPSSMTVY